MEKLPQIGVGSRLFLTASPNLEIGTRLPSGHYREKVYNNTLARRHPDGEFEKVDPHEFMEFIWEIVRLSEFSHLPSRMDSHFLWDNEDAARWWHHCRHIMNFMDSPRGYEQRHGDPNLPGLYEVEVVECSRVFAANMNLISYLDDGETFATLMERARQYWRGEGNAHNPEILLEGTVKVCRNLLAEKCENLQTTTDVEVTQNIKGSLSWTQPYEKPWSLSCKKGAVCNLEGVLGADAYLPMKFAGWIAIRLEGGKEPIRCDSGCPSVLIQPGALTEIFAKFSDFPQVLVGNRYQPVLVCNRSAAHYWQLNPYWEGVLSGEWQVIKESP